ncbi:hypothetical protein AB4876_14715 [Zhongshania guokunii]|uniref:Uncharacterized protein n=1 Tax=Zhongshania guokunii TaxID=641783 RepID=A0ABV3U892_9GAMM
MKAKTKYQIIKSNWIGFWVCIAIAIAAPIAMSLPVARPESEPFEIWFQRAGSITVIFALLAEICASKISHVFHASEGLDQAILELPQYLKAPEKLYTATVLSWP